MRACKNKNLHVLFLNTDLGYGGAEKNMAFVANVLSKEKDMRVTFLTYRDKQEDAQRLDSRIKRVRLPLETKGKDVGATLNCIRQIQRYLKKHKVDLAIAFLPPSQMRLVLACKGTNTKVLLSERADPYNKGKRKIDKLMAKLNAFLFSKADIFVFQTEMAKNYYSKKVQRKSVVIPNPITPLCRTCERNEKTIEKKIVCVARMEMKQKRQDVLLDAFNILNQEYSDYCLELYGDGEDIKVVEELAASNANIKLCGVTKDVPSVIQNASIFVLSSDYEGIPNALLEAMSLGVPCVSTDCSPGGAALLIQNNKNGLLVKRGEPMSLYIAMKYMLDHPKEAEQMGICAQSVNEDYHVKVISAKWLELIREHFRMHKNN